MSNKIDLTGQRFGRWIVIKESDKKDSGGRAMWECRCDCGNAGVVKGVYLRRGESKSCGCLLKEHAAKLGNDRFMDLTGKQFGELTVLGLDKEHDISQHNGQYKWICKCSCGEIVSVYANNLRSTNPSCSKCGYKKVSEKKSGLPSKNNRLYKIYYGMKDRCYNPNIKQYENYGGRGIAICDEWLGKTGFKNFCEWALQNGYTKNLTIDRIDVNGNYEPSNCRWATNKAQQNNKRNTQYIIVYGERLPIKQASEKYGINYHTLRKRLKKGYSPEESIKKEILKK